MLARVLLTRCLRSSTALQHYQHHRRHHHQHRPISPAFQRIPATCSIPSNHTLHTCNNRLLQQDTLSSSSTSETTSGDAQPLSMSEDMGGAEDDVSSLQEALGQKAYISPASTETLIFNGIPFDKLPIISIKATYNNTHISVGNHEGRNLARTSGGTEGFKNAKKGTAIAAQTAGIAAATKALEKGINTVRVVVKGLGPGRQSSIKGLQMGGLDIVSITDNTPVPHNGCRPRKARRL